MIKYVFNNTVEHYEQASSVGVKLPCYWPVAAQLSSLIMRLLQKNI